MVLIVTAKDTIPDQRVKTAFRQIELWANNITWQPLPLNATYVTNFGGSFRLAQFATDGFGFIQVRGLLQASGSFVASTAYTIATLPTTYAPKQGGETFAVVQTGSLARVDVDTQGNIVYVPPANISAPFISLSGLRWSTF